MLKFLKPLIDSLSALVTQLQAALLVPIAETALPDESEASTSDGEALSDARRSNDELYRCVDDQLGYLTPNGLGSLDIGAAHDD